MSRQLIQFILRTCAPKVSFTNMITSKTETENSGFFGGEEAILNIKQGISRPLRYFDLCGGFQKIDFDAYKQGGVQ